MWNYLNLRINGTNLLTQTARSHLSIMAFIMLLVALSEGLAWGYLGSTFTSSAPLLGGIGLGLFVFFLIYLFDRSLMTHDTLAEEHAYSLTSTLLPPVQSKLRKLLAAKGFIFRIFLVSLSIYITTPFLTQLVFKSDIDNYVATGAQASLVAAKERIGKDLAALKQEQLVKIKSIDAILLAEESGKYGNGVGYGKKAAALQNQKALLDNRLIILEEQAQAKLKALETAFKAKDTAVLESFGVVLKKDSPTLRNDAIKSLQANPSYQQTEQAVLILILILSGAMFGLKFISPRSLKLYFSSQLQEQYVCYSLGKYDQYLPEFEKSCNNRAYKQLPEEFERVLIEYQTNLVARKATEDQAKLRDSEAHKRARIRDYLENQKSKLSEYQELLPVLKKKVQDVSADLVSQKELELPILKEIGSVSSQIDLISNKITEMEDKDIGRTEVISFLQTTYLGKMQKQDILDTLNDDLQAFGLTRKTLEKDLADTIKEVVFITEEISKLNKELCPLSEITLKAA